MSISNNIQSIYEFPISSGEDITRLENSSEKITQQIFKIHQNKRYTHFLESTDQFDTIGKLLKITYCGSKGFPNSSQAIEIVDETDDLFNMSYTTCKELIPLFILSLQHHQAARNLVLQGRLDLARGMIEKTEELARHVTNVYENLRSKFNSLSQSCAKLALNIRGELIPYDQLKARGENNVLLTVQSSALGSAEKSTWKIHMILLNTTAIWGSALRHGETLAHSDLTDQTILDLYPLRETQDNKGSAAKLFNREDEAVELVRCKGPNLITSSSFSNPGLREFMNLVAEQTTSIEGEFESSYLNWIALAKINQIMITLFSETIESIRLTQTDIVRLERKYPKTD